MKIKLLARMLIFSLFLSNFGIISYADSYTATKIFYQPKMHNQNHNKFLNQHKKTLVEKLIHSYQNNFVSAINSGDFSLVSSDILPGSKICTVQKSTVKSYSERGIKERLISYKINSMSEFDNGDFRVVVNEKFYIQKGNQPMEYKEFENIYRVAKTNKGYKMSQILSVKILDSKTIKS